MEAFDQVMLTGSISAAARRLNRSQSALSATIAQFEESLGLSLFKRERGRLHPVPEARYLHEECKEILRRLGSVQHNMRSIRQLDAGELRIASMPGPSVSFLPDLLADFAIEHPHIECSLISRSSEAVAQLVAAQQYDLGLADVNSEADEDTGLVHAQRYRFRCMLALPAHHPLAALDRIGPQDIEGVPIACLYFEHRTTQQFLAACEAVDIEPVVRFKAQYFVPLLRYVERGLACAIVDPLTVARLSPESRNRIALRPFASTIHHDVNLITPTHRPAPLPAKRFLDVLKTELGQLETGRQPMEPSGTQE